MAKKQPESNTNQRSPWKADGSSLKTWNILLALIIGLIIILLVFRVVMSNTFYAIPMAESYMLSMDEPEEAYELEEAAEPEESFLPEPTQPPEPTATEISPEPGEVIDKSVVVSNSRLGEINLSYPVRVRPNTSNIVSLSISRPAMLASADPTSFHIVEMDQHAINTTSPDNGELHADRSTILVDDLMKVELSAQAFEVNPHFPAIQAIDLETPDIATNWAWTIIAPQAEGVHVISISVFLDETSVSPSWFGAYQIEVLAPISNPPVESGSSTESTTRGGIEELRIFSSVNQLLDFLTVISTILTGLFAIKRRHVKRRLALAEIIQDTEPTNENEEMELSDRISEYESIKWWQFWK